MIVSFEVVNRVMSFLSRHRASMSDEDVIIKPDGSPVTTRDLAGQALYVLMLEGSLGLAPGDLRLCGEETVEILRGPDRKHLRTRIAHLLHHEGHSLELDEVVEVIDRGSLRPDSGAQSTHWICDPIDGTKRFISGHTYSTCLAYVSEGRLVAGAIGVPDLHSESGPSSTGTLVGAHLGGGAFQMSRSRPSDSLKQLEISLDSIDLSAIRVARSLGAEEFGPRMNQRLSDAGLEGVSVQVDNQSKYAALVTGHIDLIAQSGDSVDNPCTWDFAPGVLVAEEFGAEVNDGSDRPFNFDTGPFLLHNSGVRCAHPKIYDSCFRMV